jgi:glycosyltransferase involved in cell wall biosynthesis
MKIAFITTVFNEEKTILRLLESLVHQSQQPDEIIIVDGGSSDRTLDVIAGSEAKQSLKIKILTKEGNRSVGRNEAIKHSSGDIIACSDAGNILDKDWLKNITAPFIDKSVDVVAGYYKGSAKNVFQKSLIPYVLVMPDKVIPDNFLPAARSVAFRKTIWEKVGGFDEKYSHNEDYVFARQLKKNGAKITFTQNAVVYWFPRNNLRQSFYMFFRFAYGDAEAGILRPKVLFIFLRYFIIPALYILFIILKSNLILNTLYLILFLYLFWSIQKNYRYVNDWRAIFILPILQLTADSAVLLGTTLGILKIQKLNEYR